MVLNTPKAGEGTLDKIASTATWSLHRTPAYGALLMNKPYLQARQAGQKLQHSARATLAQVTMRHGL